MPDVIEPYGTNQEMIEYWKEMGYVPLSGEEMKVARKKASMFVDGLSWRRMGHRSISKFDGEPVYPGSREWPRIGATDVYGYAIGGNDVPAPIRHATYEAAHYEAQNPGSLSAVVRTDQAVVREKFGDVAFDYAEPPSNVPVRTIITRVEDLMMPLFVGGNHPYGGRRLVRT